MDLSCSSFSGKISVWKGPVRSCLAAEDVGGWKGLAGVADARLDARGLGPRFEPAVRGVMEAGRKREQYASGDRFRF